MVENITELWSCQEKFGPEMQGLCAAAGVNAAVYDAALGDPPCTPSAEDRRWRRICGTGYSGGYAETLRSSLAQSQILCKLPTRREQIRIQCVRQRIYPTAACVQYNAGGDGCQGRRQGRRSSERRAAALRPLTSGPGGVIRACARQSRWTAARGSRSSPAAGRSTFS